MERLVHTAKGPWKSWGGEPCLPNMSMRRSRMACIAPGSGFFADTWSIQTMQKWSLWTFAHMVSLFLPLLWYLWPKPDTGFTMQKGHLSSFRVMVVDGANFSSCSYATYESESTSIYTFDIEFALVLASAHNLTLVCVSRRSALHQGRWHVQHQVKNSSHPLVLQGCITRQRKLTIHSHTMSHLSPEECLCRAFSLL